MFYIYIILGVLLVHCIIYYLNIDVFQFIKCKSEHNANIDNCTIINEKLNTNDLSNSIETSINELKNLNQYIDNELGQTTFC